MWPNYFTESQKGHPSTKWGNHPHYLVHLKHVSPWAYMNIQISKYVFCSVMTLPVDTRYLFLLWATRYKTWQKKATIQFIRMTILWRSCVYQHMVNQATLIAENGDIIAWLSDSIKTAWNMSNNCWQQTV